MIKYYNQLEYDEPVEEDNIEKYYETEDEFEAKIDRMVNEAIDEEFRKQHLRAQREGRLAALPEELCVAMKELLRELPLELKQKLLKEELDLIKSYVLERGRQVQQLSEDLNRTHDLYWKRLNLMDKWLCDLIGKLAVISIFITPTITIGLLWLLLFWSDG